MRPESVFEFKKDTVDLFQKRRAGHMGRWTYSKPMNDNDIVRGAQLWAKVVERAAHGSPYYVTRDEINLIEHCKSEISKYVPTGRTVIDFGPGSTLAFEKKILPLINEMGSKSYIGVDLSSAILSEIRAHIKNTRPDIVFKGIEADFFEDNFSHDATDVPEVSIMVGLTLLNLTCHPEDTTYRTTIINSLKALRAHLTDGEGYLLITQDTNRNVDTLLAAYNELREYKLNLCYKIARDISVTGTYHPDKFDLKMSFFPTTGALSLALEAVEEMHFELDDAHIDVQKGEKFYFHNAYKLPAHTFVDLAERAGFKSRAVLKMEGNPIVLHVLEASDDPINLSWRDSAY